MSEKVLEKWVELAKAHDKKALNQTALSVFIQRNILKNIENICRFLKTSAQMRTVTILLFMPRVRQFFGL